MENWIIESWPVIGKALISCVLIFVSILLVTLIGGLRTFAKMSSFDFATTIAIGSIIASVIMNDSQSWVKGSLVVAFLILLQTLFSIMKIKSKALQKIVTNSPILLMRNGKILENNLAKTNVSKSDLIAKLREANVLEMSEVHAVVFETTGDVSVLHGKDKKEVDEVILFDVEGD